MEWQIRGIPDQEKFDRNRNNVLSPQQERPSDLRIGKTTSNVHHHSLYISYKIKPTDTTQVIILMHASNTNCSYSHILS